MAFKGDNMVGMKKNNRSTVLNILHTDGSLSRKKIATKMHLTAAAITKIVGEMETEGLLTEGNTVSTGNAGRREVLVEINKDYAYALGVHINIKNVILSAVNLGGELIFQQTVSIAPSAPAEATVRTIAGILNQFLADYSIPREKITGIGIAVRGHISNDRRISLNSYGALADKNYPICERLEELMRIPAVMDNNVRALHAAQLFLSNNTANSSQIFLRCEYGIGSSISIDGEIWHGVGQSSGEIGHMQVIKENGRRCNCGRTGCLETIASPTAIREILIRNLSPETTPVLWEICQKKATAEPDLTDISKAYDESDPGVVKVIDTAMSELSTALDNVIRIIDPDTIVLYGRLFEDDVFVHLLNEKSEHDGSVVIEKSKYNCNLDDKAACLLAVKQFFNNGGKLSHG